MRSLTSFPGCPPAPSAWQLSNPFKPNEAWYRAIEGGSVTHKFEDVMAVAQIVVDVIEHAPADINSACTYRQIKDKGRLQAAAAEAAEKAEVKSNVEVAAAGVKRPRDEESDAAVRNCKTGTEDMPAAEVKPDKDAVMGPPAARAPANRAPIQ